jgi:hypothetical protein
MIHKVNSRLLPQDDENQQGSPVNIYQLKEARRSNNE